MIKKPNRLSNIIWVKNPKLEIVIVFCTENLSRIKYFKLKKVKKKAIQSFISFIRCARFLFSKANFTKTNKKTNDQISNFENRYNKFFFLRLKIIYFRKQTIKKKIFRFHFYLFFTFLLITTLKNKSNLKECHNFIVQ